MNVLASTVLSNLYDPMGHTLLARLATCTSI